MPISTIGANSLGSGAVTNAKIDTVAATKLTGQVPDANAPSGSVIQVVSTSSSVLVTTTSATILTLNITPSSASNKIYLGAQVTIGVTASSNAYADLRINRNGSTILITYDGYQSALSHYTPYSPQYVDSPNTTSSITYTLVIGRGSGGTTSVNTSEQVYSLIAMEIAA